ncbi:MAG: oxidoreductase-like domain-containing protein [Cycloclasticus sp.]
MTKKLPKPIRPENDDCCGGGGCCPCVWDTYFNALDLWEEQEEKEKALADAGKAISDVAKTD